MIRNQSMPYSLSSAQNTSHKSIIKEAEREIKLAEEDIKSWKTHQTNKSIDYTVNLPIKGNKLKNQQSLNVSSQNSPKALSQSIEYIQNKFPQTTTHQNYIPKSKLRPQMLQNNTLTSLRQKFKEANKRHANQTQEPDSSLQRVQSAQMKYNEQFQNERQTLMNEFNQIISRMNTISCNNPDMQSITRALENLDTIPSSPISYKEQQKTSDVRDKNSQLEEIQRQIESAKREYQSIVENLETFNQERNIEKDILAQQLKIKEDVIQNLQNQLSKAQRINSELDIENQQLKILNQQLQKTIEEIISNHKILEQNIHAQKQSEINHIQMLEQNQQSILQEKKQLELKIMQLNNLLNQTGDKAQHQNLQYQKEIAILKAQVQGQDFELKSLKKRMMSGAELTQYGQNEDLTSNKSQKQKRKQQKLLQRFAKILNIIKQSCYELKIDLVRKQKQIVEQFQAELTLLGQTFKSSQIKYTFIIQALKSKIEKLKKQITTLKQKKVVKKQSQPK